MSSSSSTIHSYVISLKPEIPQQLISEIQMITQQVPEHLRAIDLRDFSADALRQANIISSLAYLALTQGRCNDHMLSSCAAVGCYMSHIIAAQKIAALSPGSSSSWGLVCEDDCRIDIATLRPALKNIIDNDDNNNIDLVAFGVKVMRNCQVNPTLSCTPIGYEEKRVYGELELFKVEGTIFEGCHCLLYSQKGARKVVDILGNSPIEMQFDSALSCLTMNTDFNLWKSLKGASQIKLKGTTIQDSCVLCLFTGSGHTLIGFIVLLVFIFGAIIIAVRRRSCH